MNDWQEKVIEGLKNGTPVRQLARELCIPRRTIRSFIERKNIKKEIAEELKVKRRPKILFIDIETSTMLFHNYRNYSMNTSIDMIEEDWIIYSFAAKFFDEDVIHYHDVRGDLKGNEKKVLEEIWKLLDQADIVIGHNAKSFDDKKINARFILNGMKPPSYYKVIDTMLIAKSRFGFTSNKLAWLTDKLCKKYKKISHEKFAGSRLWLECAKGNPEAWEEMETYNRLDVLSLEELWTILRPWDRRQPVFGAYTEVIEPMQCDGCEEKDTLVHNGYYVTNLSKFDKYRCECCGKEMRGGVNHFSKEKRESLKRNLN